MHFIRSLADEKSTGLQDHTALPSATAPFVLRASIAHETSKSPPCDRSTRAALSRPPHPRPNVRDDRDTPLCAGRDGGNKQLIWGNHEADSFFARDWTAQISLKGLEKLDFSRRANCAGGREFYCWSAATKDGRSPSMPDAPRPGARQMFRKSIRQKIVGIAAGSRPSPGWLGLAALQEGWTSCDEKNWSKGLGEDYALRQRGEIKDSLGNHGRNT
jgi:hypothetical protein